MIDLPLLIAHSEYFSHDVKNLSQAFCSFNPLTTTLPFRIAFTHSYSFSKSASSTQECSNLLSPSIGTIKVYKIISYKILCDPLDHDLSRHLLFKLQGAPHTCSVWPQLQPQRPRYFQYCGLMWEPITKSAWSCRAGLCGLSTGDSGTEPLTYLS